MVSNVPKITEQTDAPPQAIETVMTKKRYLGDAVGAMGQSILMGFSSLFIYYYTEVAGIAAGVVGTLILIARLLDGISDIGMGYLIDRTKTKYGKARPWLLWMAVPTGLTGILLFYVPDIGDTGKYIYILITNVLFLSVFLTGIIQAYLTLMAVMTRNQNERALIGVNRGVFGIIGGAAVSIGFIPLVAALGNDQRSWTLLVTLFSAVSVLCILITFKYTKEHVDTSATVEKEKRIPFKTKFTFLFKNKYWVLLLIANLFAQIFYGLNASIAAYYAQYIYEDLNLIAALGAVGMVPMIVGFFFIQPFVKRFGKRNVVIAGALIGSFGFLVRLIDPYNIPLGIAGGIIGGIAMTPLMALFGAMVNDTVEYGQWKFGARMEGLVNAGNSFSAKIGNGLAPAIIGWMLTLGGYIVGQSNQSDAAKNMIIALNTYIPAITLIAIAVILIWYKLDKEYVGIVNDLEKREMQSN